MGADRAVPVPRIEQAFLAFSIVVTVVQCALLLNGAAPFRDLVTPYTGWVGAMPYMMAGATGPSLYARRVRTAPIVRLALGIQSMILVLNAGFGIVDFAMFHTLQHDPNPMLRYSAARPIWTVVIPLAWAAALWRARPSEK
jgi:hypothetical protein